MSDVEVCLNEMETQQEQAEEDIMKDKKRPPRMTKAEVQPVCSQWQKLIGQYLQGEANGCLKSVLVSLSLESWVSNHFWHLVTIVVCSWGTKAPFRIGWNPTYCLAALIKINSAV